MACIEFKALRLGYGSRTLVAAENKYHSSKLEFLAIKQAVNELSNFNFSIRYKPGIKIVVADSLTRYPLLQERNLEQYNQHLNPDEVKSAFDAVVNQVGNKEACVFAVNTINTVFGDIKNQILYNVDNFSF